MERAAKTLRRIKIHSYLNIENRNWQAVVLWKAEKNQNLNGGQARRTRHKSGSKGAGIMQEFGADAGGDHRRLYKNVRAN
jgi:hypothetical protein